MELPEKLRVDRRTVEDFGTITIIRDLTWISGEKKWAMCVDIKISHSSAHMAETTRWWICISPRYPWGNIAVYPAKDGGIKGTFNHQITNDEGEANVPWRTGDICLRVPAFALRRLGFDEDPVGQSNRLRWYLERLTKWIEAASTNTLIKDGDPFELPHIVEEIGVLGFSEIPSDLAAWKNESATVGLAEFSVLRTEPTKVAVKSFQTLSGKNVREVSWGELVTSVGQSTIGFWIRFPSLPVLPPFKAPATWGELRQCAIAQGFSLDDAIKSAASKLRNGKAVFGIIGFPIPQVIGGPLHQYHWLGFKVKPLSQGEKFAAGFRKSEEGYWRRDKAEFFADHQKIGWLSSKNWSELGTRGQLHESVRRLTATLLGAGAVGSIVAELLVRGGLREMLIVDGEILTVGNLVRHTLTMSDVELPKAVRLARRLNTTSPHAKVAGVVAVFPDIDAKYLDQSDATSLVLDCTGSDDLLASLGDRTLEHPRWYWSISVSLGARRVYAFSAFGQRFPLEVYFSSVAPWIQKDRDENLSAPMQMEGTGCWHPVFPATVDELSLMVATALKHLSLAVESDAREPKLIVFERHAQEGNFFGVSVAQQDDK